MFWWTFGRFWTHSSCKGLIFGCNVEEMSLDFSVKSSAQAIIFHRISVAEIPVVAINSNYSSLVQSESSLTMKW